MEKDYSCVIVLHNKCIVTQFEGKRHSEIDGVLYIIDRENGNQIAYFPAGHWLASIVAKSEKQRDNHTSAFKLAVDTNHKMACEIYALSSGKTPSSD